MTPRQERFVEEYLVDLNAAQAAVRAGYSARSARQIGFKVLARPEVAAEVRRRMGERAERTRVTADRVLLEIARIAYANVSDVVKWGPEGVFAIPSSELDADTLAAVAEVSETGTKEARVKVKMHDKVAALTQLGRHLGLFTDRVEHGLNLTDGERVDRLVALLERARTRRDGPAADGSG